MVFTFSVDHYLLQNYSRIGFGAKVVLGWNVLFRVCCDRANRLQGVSSFPPPTITSIQTSAQKGRIPVKGTSLQKRIGRMNNPDLSPADAAMIEKRMQLVELEQAAT